MTAARRFPSLSLVPPAALALPGAVFVTHLVLSKWIGAYEPHPWLDVPMHVLGGVVIALAGRMTLRAWTRAGQLEPLAAWVEGALLVCGTATAAVLWELAEFSTDRLGWTRAQGGLPDTMLDLLLGLVGGLLVAVIGGRRRPPDRP